MNEKLTAAFGDKYFFAQISDSSDLDYSKKISNLTAKLGLNDIGDRWQSVPESDALGVLRDIIFKSLAYSSGRTMSEREATDLAREILDSVPGRKACFVNFKRQSENLLSAISLTSATFDAGMAIVGNDEQVLFCRSEED